MIFTYRTSCNIPYEKVGDEVLSLARMLYYSKDIESFGTGLKCISEACDAAGVRYEFKKMKSGFVVCFYRSEERDDENTGIKVKSTDKLTSSQLKIIDFWLKNKRITNMDVQQLLGVKDSRALKIMKEMVDMDVVVKQGKLKGSYYVLNSKSILD